MPPSPGASGAVTATGVTDAVANGGAIATATPDTGTGTGTGTGTDQAAVLSAV
ncbi:MULTISPECIES: hypothetical protein [unclassified Microbacterium]|uniref:hypothetical protein n=1 Tax=unclassified Microbacterium TaxID=2609290 RepID=UPI001443F84D|nr:MULTISPECIES: hypothetical protein [unclassified Microbacterium]